MCPLLLYSSDVRRQPIMFIVSLLRDTVAIPPAKFGADMSDVLAQEIDLLYANKVIPGVGLCICFFDFDSIGTSRIFPGDGSAFTEVTFRMLVFSPRVGEVLIGTVKSSDEIKGLRVSFEFFDGVLVPPTQLRQPSRLYVPAL
jgi:DNA-directed RNA polymerase III subunit RPC8